MATLKNSVEHRFRVVGYGQDQLFLRRFLLKLVPFVRHEVACVFIKEIKEIRRSAAGTLPGRASGVTPRCEASGTR
jgi:hypothetical protein